MTVCRTKAGALTERVARLLLGAPSGIDSEKGQLRFGDVSVNIKTGKFYDLEDEVSGTHIDLIQRVKGLQNGQAEAWLDENVTNAQPLPLPAESAAERALIGMLAAQPNLMAAIEEEITVDHFAEIIHKQLFIAIAQAEHVAGQSISMKALMDAAGGDPLCPVAEGYTLAVYVATIIAEAPSAPDAAHLARMLATQIRSAANREGGVEDQYDLEPEPAPFIPTMGLRMWDEQDRPGPQYEYLIDDLIPERQVVVIMGESGCGKSFLGFSMGMAMARAIPFFGRRILKPVGVIWCAYEAADGTAARMRVYRKHHGLSLDPLPFGALQHPLPMWPTEPNGEVLITEAQGIERTKFNGTKIGAIFVDTYNAATPGASEIDSEVVSRIRICFRRVVEVTGAALIIIGHTNAAGKLRGNEQLPNNVDTIIKVSMKTKMDGREVIQLKDDGGLAIRTMKVIKQREGKNDDEFDFVLPWLPDGTINKFGNERTSCVVVPVGGLSAPAQAEKKGPAMSDDQANILSALRNALAENGIPTPSILKLPRSITTVCKISDWYEAYRAVASKEDDAVRKAMSRASDRFVKMKIIGRINPYVWVTTYGVPE
jgi:ABC-type dipeptide/oligopeptide/nickel transport system ATPase component